MSACHAMEDACGVHRRPAHRRPAPAAVLRGVDREPRPAHLPTARARLPRLPGRDPAGRGHRRARRAGPGAEEDRQRLMELVGGRAIHPINVRVGGFYRAPARAELRAAGRAAAPGARRGARTPCGGWPASTSPISSAITRCSRCADPGDYPIERGRGDALQRPAPFPASRVRRARDRRARCRTPTPCTPAWTRRPLPDRAAGPLHAELRPAVAAGPPGRGRRRAGRRLPQPVPQHHRAGRGDGLRDRGGAAAHRRLRAARPAPPSRCRRAPASATGSPRRRGACSTTATSSTRRADPDARIVPPTSQNQAAIEARPARSSSRPASISTTPR